MPYCTVPSWVAALLVAAAPLEGCFGSLLSASAPSRELLRVRRFGSFLRAPFRYGTVQYSSRMDGCTVVGCTAWKDGNSRMAGCTVQYLDGAVQWYGLVFMSWAGGCYHPSRRLHISGVRSVLISSCCLGGGFAPRTALSACVHTARCRHAVLLSTVPYRSEFGRLRP